MAIQISDKLAEKWPKKADKARENLLALLKDIDPAYVVLLDKLNVKFSFYKDKDESGFSRVSSGKICLNIDDFSRLSYQRRPLPSHDQRWALSTLKEEVVHYLATHYKFDISDPWLDAVEEELSGKNDLRKKLIKSQRERDSSKDDIKDFSKAYKAAIFKGKLPKPEEQQMGWQDKIEVFLGVAQEKRRISEVFAEEFLVDVLLVRDYLRHGLPKENVPTTMRSGFPLTYDLAMGFEQKIQVDALEYSLNRNKTPLLLSQEILQALVTQRGR